MHASHHASQFPVNDLGGTLARDSLTMNVTVQRPVTQVLRACVDLQSPGASKRSHSASLAGLFWPT